MKIRDVHPQRVFIFALLFQQGNQNTGIMQKYISRRRHSALMTGHDIKNRGWIRQSKKEKKKKKYRGANDHPYFVGFTGPRVGPNGNGKDKRDEIAS